MNPSADYLDKLAEAKRVAAKDSRHGDDLRRDAAVLEAAASDLRAGLHEDGEGA